MAFTLCELALQLEAEAELQERAARLDGPEVDEPMPMPVAMQMESRPKA